MQFTSEDIALMQQLDCSVRFVSRGPTFIDNPALGGGPPIIDTSRRLPPDGLMQGIACEVIDNAVGGEPYVKDIWKADDASALAAALAAAKTAEKPMTPAQRYQASRVEAVAKAKDAEIAALREQLAKAGVEAVAPVPVPAVEAPASPAPQEDKTLKPSIRRGAMNTSKN